MAKKRAPTKEIILNEKSTIRFLAKIRATDGCWDFDSKKNNGYSHFGANGEEYRAHRVSYLIFKGSLNKNLVIDHTCRNRFCVNPDHLRQVTSKINNIENSDSISARNLAKTHCSNGHEYNDENTFIKKKNNSYGRNCRQCRKDYLRQKYTKNKESILGEQKRKRIEKKWKIN